jgi:hypothetical protein
MSINTLVAIQGGSQEPQKPYEYIDKFVDDSLGWFQGNFGFSTTGWQDQSGNTDLVRSVFKYGDNILNSSEFNNTGMNAFRFNSGSNDLYPQWQSAKSSYFNTGMSNGYSYFIVCRLGDAASQLIQSNILYLFPNQVIKSDVTGFQKIAFYDESDGSNVANISYTTGDYLIITCYGSSYTNLNLINNGNTGSLSSATSTASPSSDTVFAINNGINNSFVEVAELVTYNREFSLSEREEVEGFLAHKWGLEGLLPGSHTYKASPPS